MNGFKWTIIINMARKFALPAIFGSLVLWLIHHNIDGSPKAVVSRIIKAIEMGATGRRVKGAYAMFSELTSEIVKDSGSYRSNSTAKGQIEPILDEKLVAAVVGKAAEMGVNISAELMEMLMNNVMEMVQ